MRRMSRGFSLLEVVIAMLVAAFCLLGLAAVQARALSFQVDTENRRTAAALIAQLRERVTANQQGYGQALENVAAYSQTLAAGAAITIPTCDTPTACNPVTEVPAISMAQWFREVQRQLPGAVAQTGAAAAGTVQAMAVTIGWLEPQANAVAADANCAAIAAVSDNPRYRCLRAVFFPG